MLYVYVWVICFVLWRVPTARGEGLGYVGHVPSRSLKVVGKEGEVKRSRCQEVTRSRGQGVRLDRYIVAASGCVRGEERSQDEGRPIGMLASVAGCDQDRRVVVCLPNGFLPVCGVPEVSMIFVPRRYL